MMNTIRHCLDSLQTYNCTIQNSTPKHQIRNSININKRTKRGKKKKKQIIGIIKGNSKQNESTRNLSDIQGNKAQAQELSTTTEASPSFQKKNILMARPTRCLTLRV